MQILQPHGIKNVRPHLMLCKFGNTVYRREQFSLYINLKSHILSFIYTLFLQLFIKASAAIEFFVEFVFVFCTLPISDEPSIGASKI